MTTLNTVIDIMHTVILAEACGIQDALAMLLTPPTSESMQEAITHLVKLGAIEGSPTTLTSLGQHLAAMPMDAALGKALIYGCMLR